MVKNKKLVSVIIPLKKCNEYLSENINALNNGSYKDFEIIVIPDKYEKVKYLNTKIIASGKIGPAEKRDIGAKAAKGEILAFIDDDAYPSKDWLKNAMRLFITKNVAAVCGPGVTPSQDSNLQKASGAFSSSLLGGGPYKYRFVPQKARFVDDYPSMNILVRRQDFERIGGFDTNYWPGEDTKLCHDLTKTNPNNILYDPSVLVYHHRRAIFRQHLVQNGRYGLHRGYFARILPKTSLRISYFIPSILLLSITFMPILFFMYYPLFRINFTLICTYIFFVFLSCVINFIFEKNILISLLLFPTIITTHLFYGYKFLQGFLFTSGLKT